MTKSKGSLTRHVSRIAISSMALGFVLNGAVGIAHAQDTTVDTDRADSQGEIVVTGTQIRGVAPPGASPIAVTEKFIESTGATTISQVMQTIPQLGSFGTLDTLTASTPERSVNRPNLRSLPGFVTGGGSTTLVLLDGHRLVGMGSTTTTPDPDIIPPSVLQQLEIIPDGGSAIYGSDAVAGVMNFITIDRFDGVKVEASYGFADDYYRYDGSVTAGRDWGTGSLFAAYNYAKGDQLLGRDRDYIRQFPDPGNGRTEIQCSPGNVQAGGIFYAQPNVIPGTLNQCDNSDFASVYPAYTRHSVFAGLRQELSDTIRIDIRGYYTNRKTHVLNGPYRYSASVTAARAQPPYTGLGAQTVFGQLSPDSPSKLDIELDTWGITPTVTADLDGNFQLRVLGSYGESVANRRGKSDTAVDTTALSNLIASGAFNPYNPASASPQTIGYLTSLESFGRTRQYLTNTRAVIDGSLFELPAGAVKVAVGAEYSHEKFVAQNGTVVRGFENGGFVPNGINSVLPRIPVYNLSRNIESVFGEIVVPVLGKDSGPELTFSAAGRYDHYSDVGGTFNPRFGVTLKPVEWIAIRGAWGESFNAPSLADDVNAASTDVFFLPAIINGGFRPPADLVANGTYPAFRPNTGILAIRGNSPGIEPQTATTWTVAFDVTPPFVPGLTFGATYYNIDYRNFIGLPPFENADALYRFNGNVIRTSFTQADINAVVNSDTDGIISPFGSACPLGGISGCATPAGTYAIFDARKTNFGSVKLDGIDFRASYRTDTGFGAVFFDVNGTYDLSRKQKSGTSDYRDVLSKDSNRLRTRVTAGGEVGNLLGQVTWYHRSGYDFTQPQGFTGTTIDGQVFVAQSSVDSFDTFDLYFRYDVKGSGITEDLSFTLNVENLFDRDPPEFRGTQTGVAPGITNGSTIGRFIKLGVSKKF